jgi:hypothetical protein
MFSGNTGSSRRTLHTLDVNICRVQRCCVLNFHLLRWRRANRRKQESIQVLLTLTALQSCRSPAH